MQQVTKKNCGCSCTRDYTQNKFPSILVEYFYSEKGIHCPLSLNSITTSVARELILTYCIKNNQVGADFYKKYVLNLPDDCKFKIVTENCIICECDTPCSVDLPTKYYIEFWPNIVKVFKYYDDLFFKKFEQYLNAQNLLKSAFFSKTLKSLCQESEGADKLVLCVSVQSCQIKFYRRGRCYTYFRTNCKIEEYKVCTYYVLYFFKVH